MMMDRFEQILTELSVQLGISLHPDKHRACKLKINDNIHVQIECDLQKEAILVAAFIVEIPAGKFCEEILKEALKANDQVPRLATLAFSERNRNLALYTYIPFIEISGEKLASFLAEFIKIVEEWRAAILSGRPTPSSTSTPSAPRPFFI